MAETAPLGSATRIANAADATRLADEIIATMATLRALLEEETALIKGGKISAALALEVRKAELAGRYMQGLEAVKANALAMTRFAPDTMHTMRAAHETFSQVLALNQAVLATAHAVSEGLMRGLAAEAGATPGAAGYGPGSMERRGRPQPTSLAISRKV